MRILKNVPLSQGDGDVTEIIQLWKISNITKPMTLWNEMRGWVERDFRDLLNWLCSLNTEALRDSADKQHFIDSFGSKCLFRVSQISLTMSPPASPPSAKDRRQDAACQRPWRSLMTERKHQGHQSKVKPSISPWSICFYPPRCTPSSSEGRTPEWRKVRWPGCKQRCTVDWDRDSRAAPVCQTVI